MNRDVLEERLADIFDEMSDEDIINVWNTYAYNDGYTPVYYMDDFDDIIDERYSFTPSELLDAVIEWDSSAEYFIVDDLDHISCFSDLRDKHCPIDVQQLINDIIDTDDDFDNDDIADVLDEFEEE